MLARHYYLIITILVAAIGGCFYLFLMPSSKIKQDKHLQGVAASNLSDSARTSFSNSFNLTEEIKKNPKSISATPQIISPVTEKDQIIHKVREASTTYDAASLPIIEPYLYSPDSEVREEAVNAIVNLGDKAGANLLRKYAEKESNLERKLEILKLADWLELPSGKIRVSKKKNGVFPRLEGKRQGF